MGILLNISRQRGVRRVGAPGRAAEASALVASEADFAPDEARSPLAESAEAS